MKLLGIVVTVCVSALMFAVVHAQSAQAEKVCVVCAVGGYFNGDPDDPAGDPYDPRGPEEGWPPGDPGYSPDDPPSPDWQWSPDPENPPDVEPIKPGELNWGAVFSVGGVQFGQNGPSYTIVITCWEDSPGDEECF